MSQETNTSKDLTTLVAEYLYDTYKATARKYGITTQETHNMMRDVVTHEHPKTELTVFQTYRVGDVFQPRSMFAFFLDGHQYVAAPEEWYVIYKLSSEKETVPVHPESVNEQPNKTKMIVLVYRHQEMLNKTNILNFDGILGATNIQATTLFNSDFKYLGNCAHVM